MKVIAVVLAAALLLGGCGKEVEDLCRVVTGVEVEYQQHGEVLQRAYFRQESIQSVLNYLRMLNPRGPVIPEEEGNSSCRITVHYSRGEDGVFLQRGNFYLQQNGGDWEKIDSNQAQLLYPLLLLLPSDA